MWKKWSWNFRVAYMRRFGEYMRQWGRIYSPTWGIFFWTKKNFLGCYSTENTHYRQWIYYENWFGQSKLQFKTPQKKWKFGKKVKFWQFSKKKKSSKKNFLGPKKKFPTNFRLFSSNLAKKMAKKYFFGRLLEFFSHLIFGPPYPQK